MSCSYSGEYQNNMYDRVASSVISNNNSSISENCVLSSMNDLRVTKKKCRGSKRQSAVTILNADASNFRALVQQLTGRPSEPTRLRPKKGPLNINFSKAKQVDPRLIFPFEHSTNRYHQPLHIQYKQQGFTEYHQVDHLMSSSSQSSIPIFSDIQTNNLTQDFYDIDLDIDQCLEELASFSHQT
ncbi:uncharacterized protein [Spinacia oleracea]|uniref:VQ domain-containing protein n=1 Tax=Spinacia oleracea TaxID=3562 RepID=A0A9R0IDN7_SPIOL|nr:uncharacterized protein LOC110786986 [Spinacia oleracea]